MQAHRIAYSLFNGPIHDEMVIRHRCDNPSCCNLATSKQARSKTT